MSQIKVDTITDQAGTGSPNFSNGLTGTTLTSTGLTTAATLSVTGDATFDTSTLKVDSTNNRVGVGTASPSHLLHTVGTGTSNVGLIRMEVTGSGTFNWASEAFDTNLTAGEHVVHFLGTAASTKNAGYIGYQFQSSGADANILTFGHFGADNLLNLTGDGKLGIGTTTPADTLDVSTGGIRFATGTTSLDAYQEGNFAPTISNLSNISATSSSSWSYVRIGDTVHVFGGMDLTITSASTNSSFRMTLPVNATTAFTTFGRTGGVGVPVDGVDGGSLGARPISGSTTQVLFQGTPLSSGIKGYSFHFMYQLK